MKEKISVETIASQANQCLPITERDTWEITTTDFSVSIETHDHPFQVELEPLQDASIIVTDHYEGIWNEEPFQYTMDYRRTDWLEMALKQASRYCRQRLLDADITEYFDAKPTSFERFITDLRESTATYAAVSPHGLAKHYCKLHIHLPKDTATDPLLHRSYNSVVIDDTPLWLDVTDIHTSEVHHYHRLPLYNDGSWNGIEAQSLEAGKPRLQEFVAKNETPTTPAAETVPLREAIADVVDAGAPGVALSVKPPIDKDTLIRAWLPPQHGYEAAGSYKFIEIDDTRYTVHWDFDSRPVQNPLNWRPLYCADPETGLGTVSLSDSITSVCESDTEIYDPYNVGELR